MTVAALILAGGRGTRAGGGIPKQYRQIAGKTVLRRSIECLLDVPEIDLVRVVVHPDDAELYERTVAGLDLMDPVHGGAERHLSALKGLESLEYLSPATVLIHDAARPFAPPEMIKRVICATKKTLGAIPALPVSDTLKRVDADGRIQGTVERAGLWRAQTPQGFAFKSLLEAHRARRSEIPTDDAAVMEEAGHEILVVNGDERNIKVTTEDNFARAEVLLRSTCMRVQLGSGFDVHQFGPGDHVMLCGIDIPFEHGLVGHSDADVALHALTDALLGAVGAGDIGQHFPPSDLRWKGAASSHFVEESARLIAEAGGRINNVDITIVGERPKIGPHRDKMRSRVAELLSLPVDRVNVKATTTEKLGFTGRGEGLAAQAMASVDMPANE